MSNVIRPSLESASSVAASARVACLHTSRIEKPCFCALPDASCTLHSVDIEPEMSRTTITSIAVFVAGASHLISTRAASSMPSTTRRAKLSCFGGACGSSAGEFGGAGGSVNTPWGSRGDLFVMVVWCGVVFASVLCGCGRCFAVCCGVCEAVGSLKSQQMCVLLGVIALSEMIPGGLATFLKGSLRGTRLRRRGEPSGRVAAEDVAFRRLLCLASVLS